jgi:hypothetical protein
MNVEKNTAMRISRQRSPIQTMIDQNQSESAEYSVRVNYRRISLRHNLSRKCRKIVKFVSITHSERNI